MTTLAIINLPNNEKEVRPREEKNNKRKRSRLPPLPTNSTQKKLRKNPKPKTKTKATPKQKKKPRKKRLKLVISNRESFSNRLEELVRGFDNNSAAEQSNQGQETKEIETKQSGKGIPTHSEEHDQEHNQEKENNHNKDNNNTKLLLSELVQRLSKCPQVLTKNTESTTPPVCLEFLNVKQWCTEVEECIHSLYPDNRSQYVFQFSALFEALQYFEGTLFDAVGLSARAVASCDYEKLWELYEEWVSNQLNSKNARVPHENDAEKEEEKIQEPDSDLVLAEQLRLAHSDATAFLRHTHKDKIMYILKLDRKTDWLQCSHCKSNNVIIKKIFQTRGLDEPLTVHLSCKNCGFGGG